MNKILPDTREMIAQLIATPSVSCTHASMDMSNRAVIDLLAGWCEQLGFAIEIQPVDERKFNLIARAGSGSDGLVLSGHTDTCPVIPSCGPRTHLKSFSRTTCYMALAVVI